MDLNITQNVTGNITSNLQNSGIQDTIKSIALKVNPDLFTGIFILAFILILIFGLDSKNNKLTSAGKYAIVAAIISWVLVTFLLK